MKNQIFLFAIIGLLFTACDVDQTKEAKMPQVDVDVDTKAGQMPAFDVDWADVNVGTKTKMVEIPKLVVVMEEEEIEVPYVDVDMPNSGEKEERTLLVEAEVTDKSHTLEIDEVYATKNRLYVISSLEETGKDIGKQKMRVSDRLVLNAPDLDVKYYIIGERPDGIHNSQYTYISSRSKIADKLSNGKKIYGS